MVAVQVLMRKLKFVSRLGIGLVAVNILLLLPEMLALAGGTGLYRTKDLFLAQFAVGREANLFTWYSSFLLTAAAFAALANFWLDGQRSGISPWRFAWLGVFLVMMVLSLEEVARLHETFQYLVQRWARQGSQSPGWLWRDGRVWVMLYSPAIVAVIVFFFFTFSRMFRGFVGPRNLALGGLCLWIAVVALEFFYIDRNRLAPRSWARRFHRQIHGSCRWKWSPRLNIL
jgi:hypothetical protein